LAVRRIYLLAAVLALLGLGLLAGCNLRPTISDLKVDPPTFSPNADGKDDITRISYTISQGMDIDLYFVGPDGQKHYFRQGERRVPGNYFVMFGGAVDNKLLPDGRYTVTVETNSGGSAARVEAPMTISGGDQIPLQLTKLQVYPDTFTPNRDGINDRVSISYYINKDANVFVSLVSSDGKTQYPIPPELITKPGVKGSHEHDYDAGVDLGAKPPPDGMYTIVAEAVDPVGNRVRATTPLTITGGGVPMAEIVNRAAEWSPTVVPLGDTLTFTCTVENIGPVPIRTKGPPPGTTYNTHENYSTLGSFEEPGIFRLGADSEGNTEGRKYPYRWQLGRDDELKIIDGQKYLMPGQRVTIVGHIQIADKPPKVAPKYWLGLVHEQVEIVNDFVQVTDITVDY
jgi:uncharacterized repeat protein (TIGR01451 family)